MMNTRIRQAAYACLLAVAFLAFAAIPALGVDIAGKVRGRVVDPSGALVPGATITARGSRTGVEVKTTSAADGTYSFQSLLPGVYSVTCEYPGFKKFATSEITVASQQTTTLDITLTVGDVTQRVEVVAAATQVDTTNAAIQNTLGDRLLMALPVSGRDVRYAAELTQPGTIEGPPSHTGPTTRVNGTRGNTSNNYKVDGTESIDYYNGSASNFPAPENLQEFTVLTNAYGAKYGTGVGSQVTAVIKSGTNDLHGMGWTYFTNSAWNANSWEGNWTGMPKPSGSQRWFGGNVGGPVYIPHVYDGRNKTFFFVSYEHTSRFFQQLQRQRALTNAERSGDFSNVIDFPVPVINGVETPILSPADFSPMAKALLANASLFPTTSDPNGVLTWMGTGTETSQPFIVKVDQQFGSKHRVFGSLYWYRDDNVWDPLMGIQFAAPTLPNEGASSFNTNLKAWSFNYTYNISPNMLNTVVVGLRPLDIAVLRSRVNEDLNWNNVGVPNMQTETGASPTQVGIFVNGWSPQGFTLWGNYDNPLHEYDTYVADDFTWIKGRHTLQAGFDIRTHHNDNYQNWVAAGAFYFDAGNQGSTGNPFADFLLGQGAAFEQDSLLNNKLRYPAREAYVQDQIKVSRKLTATLGVRWSPHFGVRESSGKLGAFRPGQQSTEFPHAPLGLVVPGDAGIDPATYPNRYLNFAPRIGIAYDLLGNGKMALRAGYGIYYDYENLLGFDQFATNVPYGFLYTPAAPVSLADPYNGQKLFPYHIPVPGSEEAKNFIFPPSTVLSLGGFSPDYNAARVHQWNVSYQWEPVKNYLVSAAYVATRGTHLSSSYNLNTPLFIPGASNADNEQDRRPYPYVLNIYENFSGANSWYNSLQVTLNKRFSRGVTILGVYTYSKATDTGDTVGSNFSGGSYRDPRRRYLDSGPSGADLRHVLSVTYSWELPFPARAGKWLKVGLGGWVWGGTLRATSGDPLTISSPADFDFLSANGAWANYAGGPMYGDHSTRASQAANWLNGNVFCPANATGPDCTVDPEAGVSYLAIGNSKRGMARGPGRFLNNMTLTKRFPFSERWGTLEFRAAAFNVFNHTVLGDPVTDIAERGGAFGQIYTAGPPRTMQLSIRYLF